MLIRHTYIDNAKAVLLTDHALVRSHLLPAIFIVDLCLNKMSACVLAIYLLSC